MRADRRVPIQCFFVYQTSKKSVIQPCLQIHVIWRGYMHWVFLRDKSTVYNHGKLNHSHTKRIRIRQTQVRWVDRSESDSEAPSPVLLQPGFDPNPGRELVPGELRLVSQSLESVTKSQPWIGNYEV